MEYFHKGEAVYTERNRLEFLAENAALQETFLHRPQQLDFKKF
jgi:hypothetical protein